MSIDFGERKTKRFKMVLTLNIEVSYSEDWELDEFQSEITGQVLGGSLYEESNLEDPIREAIFSSTVRTNSGLIIVEEVGRDVEVVK